MRPAPSLLAAFARMHTPHTLTGHVRLSLHCRGSALLRESLPPWGDPFKAFNFQLKCHLSWANFPNELPHPRSTPV